MLVYAVEEGALISKQPVYIYQYYMLNNDAKERFQNHTVHGRKFR